MYSQARCHSREGGNPFSAGLLYALVSIVSFIILLLVAGAALIGILIFAWKTRPRRRPEPGFKYIFVNLDGSARELSEGERAYLNTDFKGADGNRPYIKLNYESVDGSGNIYGFLSRRQLPSEIKIVPVNPNYDVLEQEMRETDEEDMIGRGYIAVRREDNMVSYAPDPALSNEERMKKAKMHDEEQELKREELAKIKASN